MMKDNIADTDLPPVLIENQQGKSRFVILCDHSSNNIPKKYDNLGISEAERQMHVAWDPGTLDVAKTLAQMFDAPLIYSTISRLVIDKNRSRDRNDLIPSTSEYIKISGNENISQTERQQRINDYHIPYHNAITNLLDEREELGINNVIMSIHSFTPTYMGIKRPWEIGLIPGIDERFTRAVFEALNENKEPMNVGWNEPYAADHGVHYTMDIHSDKRGLHGTMVEIRNNEIADEGGIDRWVKILGSAMKSAINKI